MLRLRDQPQARGGVRGLHERLEPGAVDTLVALRDAAVGDRDDVYARAVELVARGEPTIAIHLARSGDGFAAFATDDLGRVAVLGGAEGSLRMRPAGDALSVPVTAVASDPALARAIRERLRPGALSGRRGSE